MPIIPLLTYEKDANGAGIELRMSALHSHPFQIPESCPKAKVEILINRFFPPLPVVDFFDIEILPNYLPSSIQEKLPSMKYTQLF